MPGSVDGHRACQTALAFHDGRALGPGVTEVLGPRARLRPSHSCCPTPEGQRACHPRLIHILIAPIRRGLKHRHPLAAQPRLAGELAPLLLPGGGGAPPQAFSQRLGKTATPAPRTAAARAA